MTGEDRGPERVLISGGAGFIGTALGQALTDAGHEVLALDNLLAQVHGPPHEAPRASSAGRLVQADVRCASAWKEAVRALRPTTVVHLAAETGTGQSLTETSRHASVNVVGTARMLDALYEAQPWAPHLVLASSRAVYGEGPWRAGDELFHPGPRAPADLAAGRWDPRGPQDLPVEPLPSRADITHPRPSNVYGATKLAQEHLCVTWAAATGTRLSVLRLQNVYGPGQSLINPYTGVVSLFAQRALAGGSIELYEDGRIVRDFVFIDDVVDVFVSAIVTPPSGQRILDVGSAAPTTLNEVARLLARHEGAPEPFVSGRFRKGDVRAASCDLTRTRDELGYEPVWSLEQGLVRLLDWIRGQPSRGSTRRADLPAA